MSLRIGFLSVLLWLVTTGAVATTAADSVRSAVRGDTLPVPPASPKMLFYVQRTSNINTIVYELNADPQGKPVAADPVRIYWIRYAESGQTADLNYVQRNFAYGLTVKQAKDGSFDLNFVSYKRMKLTLRYSETDKRYEVFAQRSSSKVRVTRFFVRVDGGTFWLPKITYVQIDGVDTATGKPYSERFKPQ